MSSRSPQTVPLDAVLRQALQCLQAKQWEEAERLYRIVVQAQPTHASANFNLGVLAVQQGKPESGLPFLKAALAASPAKEQYRLSLADVLLRTGAAPEALAVLQQGGLSGPVYESMMARAREALPKNDARSLHDAALQHHMHGRLTEAAELYRRALDLDPEHAEAHCHLGNLLYAQRDFVKAESSYRSAIRIKAEYAESHFNLGLVLKALNRTSEAIDAYRDAIRMQPHYVPAHLNLGSTLWEAGQIAVGFAAFRAHADLTGNQEAKETPAHKTRHDDEQRQYLASIGVDPAPVGRSLYIEGGERVSVPAVSRNADRGAIETKWQNANPQIAVIDNLLTPEALAELRRFCWGSTIWREAYERGYLGAFPEYGFTCPLLAQIGEELRETYPAIFGTHNLLQAWAFKYDSRLSGIKLHADFAAVNVNFWITPDEANLDADGGGLVVWDTPAPLDWDFEKYNKNETNSREFLKRSNANSVTIPHRANRAVIFDSDLFHETDKINFKEGYLNRRINVTFLYGRREQA